MGVVYVVLIVMVLLNAVWLWAADCLLRRAAVASRWRWAGACFVLLMVAGLAWLMVNRRLQANVPPPSAVMSILMLWHMLVLPLSLALLAVAAGIRLLLSGAAKLHGRPTSALRANTTGAAPAVDANDTPSMHEGDARLNRRQFLYTASAAVPPLVALGATGMAVPQTSTFRVRRLDVALANLPTALDGLTIAHVADTHVGRFTRGRVLDRIIDATNRINDGKPADLVLLTGDLINDSNHDLPAAIDMVRAMKSRFGVYMCEGNHDLIDDGARFKRDVLQADLPLLRNEAANLDIHGQHVQILGLIWGPPGRLPGQRARSTEADIASSVAATLEHRHADAFPIMLAHHPHAFDYAATAGVPLTLAGHTHGGQLHLSDDLGFGPWLYRYWSGLYRDGDAACVVSNGVGNWFPLRINAPAEIIRITLRRLRS